MTARTAGGNSEMVHDVAMAADGGLVLVEVVRRQVRVLSDRAAE